MAAAARRWAWLTPDLAAAGGTFTARRLVIPNAYLPHVNGALAQLCETYAWEAFGAVSPAQAARDMQSMLLAYLESSDTMIGSIHTYAGPLPPGVLECDGAAYLRADYPLLYDRLDAAYHVDSDIFTVPDLRGRFIVGAGLGYDLRDTGGLSHVTLTVDQMPSHSHGYNEATINDVDLEDVGIPQPAVAYALPSLTGTAGGDEAHENRPPYYALRVGILGR